MTYSHDRFINVKWHGSDVVELIDKDTNGQPHTQLLLRHDEPTLEIVAEGRPWSFDGDGALLRLVSEAHRIRLAHRGAILGWGTCLRW